jgi:hypothetical protein
MSFAKVTPHYCADCNEGKPKDSNPGEAEE